MTLFFVLEGRIFVADVGKAMLYMNLDGSDVHTLTTDAMDYEPTDVVFDSGFVYWTDEYTGGIVKVANYSTTPTFTEMASGVFDNPQRLYIIQSTDLLGQLLQ